MEYGEALHEIQRHMFSTPEKAQRVIIISGKNGTDHSTFTELFLIDLWQRDPKAWRKILNARMREENDALTESDCPR